ncbi:hypothetical protein [Microlunatus aurantiacus]|uniref:hypothetical protein n=1 Tax=Microlunatus aurantiacus TaxID=446786 RepID=UPI0031D0CEFE
MGGDGDVDRLLASIDRRVGQDLPAWPGGWPGQIEAALFDAVFSMQARYGGSTTGVRAVVARWRDHRGGQVDDLAELAAADPEAVADIVRNRAKASRRLKAAIVVEAAGALANAGLIHAADFTGHPDQRRAYLSVRGSGPVTWTYFGMLLGVSGVKADTWIVRFVRDAVGRSVTPTEAEALVSAAAAELSVPDSQLDHAIWQAARSSARRSR